MGRRCFSTAKWSGYALSPSRRMLGLAPRSSSSCRAGCLRLLDMSLQLGPGRESIFARNHQLRIRKCERRRGDLFFQQASPSRMVLANAS